MAPTKLSYIYIYICPDGFAVIFSCQPRDCQGDLAAAVSRCRATKQVATVLATCLELLERKAMSVFTLWSLPEYGPTKATI